MNKQDITNKIDQLVRDAYNVCLFADSFSEEEECKQALTNSYKDLFEILQIPLPKYKPYMVQ